MSMYCLGLYLSRLLALPVSRLVTIDSFVRTDVNSPVSVRLYEGFGELHPPCAGDTFSGAAHLGTE